MTGRAPRQAPHTYGEEWEAETGRNAAPCPQGAPGKSPSLGLGLLARHTRASTLSRDSERQAPATCPLPASPGEEARPPGRARDTRWGPGEGRGTREGPEALCGTGRPAHLHSTCQRGTGAGAGTATFSSPRARTGQEAGDRSWV